MDRDKLIGYGRLAWEKAWWILPWLIAVWALSVFWSHATPHLCYKKYWLSGDAGVTVYNSFQVAEGKALYTDIFEFKFPLFFWLWGTLMWIVGPSAAAAQWAMLLTISLVAPVVAVTTQRLGGNRLFATAAGVVPVLLFFAAWPFPFTPWLGWLMFAMAAFSLERAFRNYNVDATGDDDGLDLTWLIRAGMFTGLFILSIQSMALPFSGGATVALALVIPRKRWTTALWFICGGLIVAVPILFYYLVIGGLGTAIDQTLVWPVTHYYDGWVKGNYPGAALVEFFQKKGLCKATPSPTMNGLYSTSLIGIPALAVMSWLGTISVTGFMVYRRIRYGASKVARSPRALVLGVLAGGGMISFSPQVIEPSLSDMAHVSFAALMVVVPFALAATFWNRWWRMGAQGVFFALLLVLVVVYGHRHNKFKPFKKKYRNFDSYVERYAGAQWMKQLTEPGDTIVHMSYGGWQYLTTRPAGVSFTWVFNDDKIHPKRHWKRIIKDIKDRKPTLLQFRDRGLWNRFVRMDPSLRKRYFHNGLGWERQVPPLPHDSVAGKYTMRLNKANGGVLTISQKGQRITGVRIHANKKKTRVTMRGSVRGNRIFLYARGKEWYLLRVQPDGSVVGEFKGYGRKYRATLTQAK